MAKKVWTFRHEDGMHTVELAPFVLVLSETDPP